MNALQRFGLNGKNLLEFVKNMFVGNARDVSLPWYNTDDSVTTYTYPNFPKQMETAEQHFVNIQNKLPIQPNLYRNSKNFKWTGKQKGVFYNNELPDYWHWYNYNGGDLQFKAMVIDAADTQTLAQYNIQNPFDGIPLCGPYGNDVAILYIEATKTKGYAVFMAQPSTRYTAWGKGNFIIGARAYYNIIDITGDIKFHLGNENAYIATDKANKGKGWVKTVAHKEGFGGSSQGVITGNGAIKFAIALPYAYVGYIPEGIDAWSGFVGTTTSSYTHQDLIIGE